MLVSIATRSSILETDLRGSPEEYHTRSMFLYRRSGPRRLTVAEFGHLALTPSLPRPPARSHLNQLLVAKLFGACSLLLFLPVSGVLLLRTTAMSPRRCRCCGRFPSTPANKNTTQPSQVLFIWQTCVHKQSQVGSPHPGPRLSAPPPPYVTSRLVTLLIMCERRGTRSRSNVLS